MDVTVTGRHCTVSENTRDIVTERLTEAVAKLNDRVIRMEVEFTATDPKGSPDDTMRCEITMRGRGPVVRARADAEDKLLAFEKALEKLKSQLRKAADRRKDRRGLRLQDLENYSPEVVADVPQETGPQTHNIHGIEVTGDGPLVVREKAFTTVPLTLAQALDEMELVGHDFFLYQDAASGRPSVVYRRKAYDYGVIHLDVTA